MTMFASILEEALESWSDVRQGLVDEVENIPENQFEFRPTPQVKNVRELLQHILEVALMMTGELTRQDTDFHRAPWPDLLALYASQLNDATTKPALLELLESSLRDAETAFRKAGELHMLQFITRFDGQPGTRLAWLYHGIAQEMYHRGQLVIYERLMGIEPALTKKIRGGA